MIFPKTLAATTAAVEWSFSVADDFKVSRLALMFDSAPTQDLVYVSVDSKAGAAFDHVIRTINPVGQTQIQIEGLTGFAYGDAVKVTFANTDGVSVTGIAMCEVQPNPLPSGGVRIEGGLITSEVANHYRYYHLAIGSAAPGASGASRLVANANQLGGWLLDAAAEYLEGHVDVHDDWDGTTPPTTELWFTIQDSNAGGTDNDNIILRVIARYAQPGIGIRTQTVDCPVVVGKAAQYSIWKCEIDLDPLAADNPIAAGDAVMLTIYVLDTGTIKKAVINSISFYYPTTHIGLRSGDI